MPVSEAGNAMVAPCAPTPIEMDRERMIEFKESMRSFLSLMDERILTLEAAGGDTALARLEIAKAQAARGLCVAFKDAILLGKRLDLTLHLEGREPVPPIPPENNP